jgi:hypothetical protein
MMTLLLPIHIIGGLLGLAAGAVALYAWKGAKLHRQSGMIFVYSMLALSATGAGMAALQPNRVDMIAGLLTFYLVTTALFTVRRPVMKPQWIDAGAMLVGLAVGIAGISLGVEAVNSATGTVDEYPPAPAFIFGAVALLAAFGDARMLLARGFRGTQRLARHLWRMCFALFIAAGSFFLGQADLFPEPIRIMPLLALPVLLVLFLMVYWLARVLFTKWRPYASLNARAPAPTMPPGA